MRFQIYWFLFQYIIFCNHCYFTKALVGLNVRSTQEQKYSFIACVVRRTGQRIVPNEDLKCTGSLVSKKHVLTVEHCVRNDPLPSFQVIFGFNLFNGSVRYPEKITSFETWAKEKGKKILFDSNDVAIIRLTEKVSGTFTPIRISFKPDEKLYGAFAETLGWGLNNNGTVPETPQVVPLKVLHRSECEDRVTIISGEKLYCEIRILCSFTTPFSLLQYGDSGGPLLFGSKLVAINKGVAPNPETEFDSRKVNIHFNLNFYKEFIQSVIKN